VVLGFGSTRKKTNKINSLKTIERHMAWINNVNQTCFQGRSRDDPLGNSSPEHVPLQVDDGTIFSSRDALSDGGSIHGVVSA